MKENRLNSDSYYKREELEYIEGLIKTENESTFEYELRDFDDWDSITDHWNYVHDTAFSSFKFRFGIDEEEDLNELLDFFYSHE